MIPGPTFCCFVCFLLCLEHPCNFAFGIPIPNALTGRLDVSAMQLPKKCDCTGLGNANFETKLLCCYCGVRFRQWNLIFLLNPALKLYQFVLTFFGVRVLSYSRYFSICDVDTHPINRIGVCPDAVAFAAGWCLLLFLYDSMLVADVFCQKLWFDTHGCGNFI